MTDPSPHPSNLSECPENVFSNEQIDLRLMGNMPISVCGMFTNLINIVVFLDVEMRCSLVNHFLLALSISDLLLLVFNFFFLIFPVIASMSDNIELHNAYPVFLWYSYPLALTTQTCGVYLTVLVSVHRYLGVCHPFRAKRWVSGRPVKSAIIGSILFSVLINLPTWMELHIVPCYSMQFKTTVNTVALSELKNSRLYDIIAKVIGYTMVMFIIPFITLIFVNCRIIVALQQSKHLRNMHSSKKSNQSRVMHQFRLLKTSKYSDLFQNFTKMANIQNFRSPSFLKSNNNSVRDRSVTMMLLAIVGIFLCCNCLAFCNNLIEILKKEDWVHIRFELFEMSVEMGNILISLNSSSSILVYMIFSSKYRAIIKHWLGLEKRKRVNGVALTTALAAQRALELSVLPDEADTRRRRSNAEKFNQLNQLKKPLVKQTSSHSDIRTEEEVELDQDSDTRRTSSKRKLLRFATLPLSLVRQKVVVDDNDDTTMIAQTVRRNEATSTQTATGTTVLANKAARSAATTMSSTDAEIERLKQWLTTEKKQKDTYEETCKELTEKLKISQRQTTEIRTQYKDKLQALEQVHKRTIKSLQDQLKQTMRTTQTVPQCAPTSPANRNINTTPPATPARTTSATPSTPTSTNGTIEQYQAKVHDHIPYDAIRVRIDHTQSSPVCGAIPKGSTYTFVQTLANAEGVWAQLSESMISIFCAPKYAECSKIRINGEVVPRKAWTLMYDESKEEQLSAVDAETARALLMQNL